MTVMLTLLMLVLQSFSLCCTPTPNGGLACQDAAVADAQWCPWTATCSSEDWQPFPECDGTELLATVDLRCCSHVAAVNGQQLEGCSTTGTVLGVMPWCKQAVLDAVTSCPTGWLEDGPDHWSCG